MEMVFRAQGNLCTRVRYSSNLLYLLPLSNYYELSLSLSDSLLLTYDSLHSVVPSLKWLATETIATGPKAFLQQRKIMA